MRIYNSLQLRNGAKAETNKISHGLTQPIQFLSKKDKTEEWAAENMNWLELQGLAQLRRTAPRLLRNYKLANGVINKSDYIVQEDNEYSDIVEALTKEEATPLELKFFPIIPVAKRVLCTEFAKRISKIQYHTTDELSNNERLAEKEEAIEQILLAQASQKMQQKLVEIGMDPNSDDFKQQMSPENLKTLPDVEDYFRKSYRSRYEEWATHQHNDDVERFKMYELEQRGFEDMLITDREFWHFRMLENDYELELWNPTQVFYHKSPSCRYISDGQWVGMIDLLSVADVVDRYGWMMSEEQLSSLESIYPIKGAGYLLPGMQNDGSYYDATKSHAWNTQGPGLDMRRFMSAYSATGTGDIVDKILAESEDTFDTGHSYLLRVSTIYWKSQRKVGHLTKKDADQNLTQSIVDESYKITDKPIYDTQTYKIKSKDNLVFGEHIDWIWINEIWGGVRIGANRPVSWTNSNSDDMTPIYLGVDGPSPARLKFQFKGDNSLYGCKLPVEGAIFSDRNVKSNSMVDMMAPFQIGHNMVNNQMADLLMDELGTVIIFDQNGLPRHSMGEDWGKGNLQNAYLAMKNFQMLPLDTSLANTEQAVNFQHYQQFDMSQTNRLMGRIQLSNYYKQAALEVIGITPQRLGQQLTVQDSAKGIEMGQNASFATTEMFFIQHSDYLMPRVHQMRTNLAQYYNSTNPSIRLQYITSNDERVAFEIDGTSLPFREFNLHCSTRMNSRAIMEQLKQMVLSNNTTGATIFDLGGVIKADSLAEMDRVMKASEDKVQVQRQQEQQQQQEAEDRRLQKEQQDKMDERAFQAQQNDNRNRTLIQEAEIRAASSLAFDTKGEDYGHYEDEMARIQAQGEHNEQMNFKREQEINKQRGAEQDRALKEKELNVRQNVAQDQIDVARINRNKYSLPEKKGKKG